MKILLSFECIPDSRFYSFNSIFTCLPCQVFCQPNGQVDVSTCHLEPRCNVQVAAQVASVTLTEETNLEPVEPVARITSKPSSSAANAISPTTASDPCHLPAAPHHSFFSSLPMAGDYVVVCVSPTHKGGHVAYFVGSIMEENCDGWRVQLLRRNYCTFTFYFPAADEIYMYSTEQIVRILTPPKVGRCHTFCADELRQFEEHLR